MTKPKKISNTDELGRKLVAAQEEIKRLQLLISQSTRTMTEVAEVAEVAEVTEAIMMERVRTIVAIILKDASESVKANAFKRAEMFKYNGGEVPSSVIVELHAAERIMQLAEEAVGHPLSISVGKY